MSFQNECDLRIIIIILIAKNGMIIVYWVHRDPIDVESNTCEREPPAQTKKVSVEIEPPAKTKKVYVEIKLLRVRTEYPCHCDMHTFSFDRIISDTQLAGKDEKAHEGRCGYSKNGLYVAVCEKNLLREFLKMV